MTIFFNIVIRGAYISLVCVPCGPKLLPLPYLFTFTPFPQSLFSLPLPLEVGPLKFSWRFWFSVAVSYPSGVWGGAPAEI